MWRVVTAVVLAGCVGNPGGFGQRPTGQAGPAHLQAPAQNPNEPGKSAAAIPGEKPAGAKKAPVLFARRPRGWAAVDARMVAQTRAFAAQYADYLAAAKTPRRAIAGLVALFAGRGQKLESGAEHHPGARYWLLGAGDAAAFVMLGTRPIEDGVRIVVTSVDAPRIDLKQRPAYDRAGFTMFDTELYGDPELSLWLSRPLALYIYAARPGAAGGPLDIAIGDSDGDPVLVIPDLLPHLSGNVQGKKIVDRAERMDAIAAHTWTGLDKFLAQRETDLGVLTEAEASLVPAGRPAFVGVDETLLAGYGHSHRAFAYAAVRALADATSAETTAVVVATSRAHLRHAGTSGLGFVKIALSRLVGELSSSGDLDVLATRRFYARSAALVTSQLSGQLSHGLILAPRVDRAVPRATRRVIDSLVAAGVQYQMSDKPGASAARALSALDLDAVAVAIPTLGHNAPRELISTLDLYQARMACRKWLTTR